MTVATRPAPHGTSARYRKHYRDGELPCEECRLAANRAAHSQEVRQNEPTRAEKVNGQPEPVRYAWRARTYPWAVQVLRRAEDRWGSPQDAGTC